MNRFIAAFCTLVLAMVAMAGLAPEAFAQAASAISSAVADPSTSVSFDLASVINPIIEVLGVIAGTAVTFIVVRLVGLLPGWVQVLFTAAVQAQMGSFIRQGIAWAIQEVVGFDKDKTITLDVGNAGVAAALRYVIEHAPSFLVDLAGGKDAIVEKIIAFLTEHGIVLDTAVSPAEVANTASKAVAG